MGLLDGLIGGAVGAGLATVVQDVMEKHGGVQGMVAEFQSKGLGEAVKSWVGTGPNAAISGDDVHKVLGPDLLNSLAQKTGMPIDELKAKLAQIIPQAVDHMTPGGKLPT
ncbi:MAG: YidB family protein [Alphaproteobacteria bacterium]